MEPATRHSETETRGPGRPVEFNLDAALDSAVDIFWERGYRKTTTRELEARLGLGQSSISHHFGTKRDLLMTAIDRYEARMEMELFPLLDEPGVGSLDAFFKVLGEWIERNESRGCLVVNLMASESDDSAIGERVTQYRAKIRESFHAPLMRLNEDTADSRAELLTAAVLGLHVTARSSGGEDEVSAMVASIRDQLSDWVSSA